MIDEKTSDEMLQLAEALTRAGNADQYCAETRAALIAAISAVYANALLARGLHDVAGAIRALGAK